MHARHALAAAALGLSLMTLAPATRATLVDPPVASAFDTRELALPDHRTRLLDTGGSGEPLVLIHGLAADHQMWNEVAAQLAGRYRVIAYDVRGHGAAAGAPKPFSVPVFAEDLRRLLDALGLRQAHVVGMSMGGAIAQQFAISHPDRVRSLALVATFSKAQPAFAARGQAGLRDGMVAQIVPTLTRWFTPAALAENRGGVQYARASVLQARPDDWVASWTALAGVDVHQSLGSIRVPTKVIAGELDLSCPPELMKNDIAAHIPGARFHVIPGASHMVTLGKARELAALLRD